jgi:hypothetical protein
MLESYHFQNTPDKLSITPYSKNRKSAVTFGVLGIIVLLLPLFIHQNIYFTWFLILLGIIMLFQAGYDYLNINTVVTFNKKDRCIYQTFMGKEKMIMTFQQAGVIKWTVNNRMEFFALTKNKSNSKRYVISHRYSVKKDAAEVALYQKEILAAIDNLIANN